MIGGVRIWLVGTGKFPVVAGGGGKAPVVVVAPPGAGNGFAGVCGAGVVCAWPKTKMAAQKQPTTGISLVGIKPLPLRREQKGGRSGPTLWQEQTFCLVPELSRNPLATHPELLKASAGSHLAKTS